MPLTKEETEKGIEMIPSKQPPITERFSISEEFIELLRHPTEEITQTINKDFLKKNDAKNILRFVGDLAESFVKLDPKCESSFEIFSEGDAETFKEMHKKASDVFKHVFNSLGSD